MFTGDVIVCGLRRLARSDADDAKRRMLGRIGDLALQRLEAAPDDIGFAEAKLPSQLLKPTTLPTVEINLYRLAYPVHLPIMSFCHDSMLWSHERRIKPVRGRIDIF